MITATTRSGVPDLERKIPIAVVTRKAEEPGLDQGRETKNFVKIATKDEGPVVPDLRAAPDLEHTIPIKTVTIGSEDLNHDRRSLNFVKIAIESGGLDLNLYRTIPHCVKITSQSEAPNLDHMNSRSKKTKESKNHDHERKSPLDLVEVTIKNLDHTNPRLEKTMKETEKHGCKSLLNLVEVMIKNLDHTIASLKKATKETENHGCKSLMSLVDVTI